MDNFIPRDRKDAPSCDETTAIEWPEQRTLKERENVDHALEEMFSGSDQMSAYVPAKRRD